MTKILSYQFDEIIIKVYKDKFKDINLAKLWLNVANYTDLKTPIRRVKL